MTLGQVNAPAATPTDPAFDLLIDGLIARMQAGESVDWSAVAREHPEHAERLRSMAPALQAIVHLSRAGASVVSGIAPQAAGDDLIPGVLGDFRILREVGRGGMGVVYEAEQVSLGRRVALKVLPFAAAVDPKQLQRFKNEAKAAAYLRHENIVDVYGVGCDRGVHYYAMQFIEGLSLAAVIHALNPPNSAAQECQPPGQSETTDLVAALSTERSHRNGREFYRTAARLIAEAADALDHAHHLGIVHRDVKPANLLLDQAGKLYVSDFGLARFGTDAGLTMTGDQLGTLRYMAPEQALAEHDLVDQRADVYGLGATLYELLTGRPAADATNRVEILRQVIDGDPIRPRKHTPAIPVELETIVLKALEKDPEDRYASAQEVANDLRRWLRDEPIRAKPQGLWVRALKWTRRHQGWCLGAMAVLAATAVVAVIGYVRTSAALDEASAERDRATTYHHETFTAVNEILAKLNDERFTGVPGIAQLRREIAEQALQHTEYLYVSPADKAKAPVEKLQVGWSYMVMGHGAWHDQPSDHAISALNRAVVYFEQIVSDYPDNEICLQQLALARWYLGLKLHERGRPVQAYQHFREAIGQIRRAVRRNPFRHSALNNAAWYLSFCPDPSLRDAAEAVGLAKQAVEQSPNTGKYWHTLGTAYFRAGELDAAERAIRKNMELSQMGNSYDFFFLAMIRWKLGDRKGALAWYEDGIRRSSVDGGPQPRVMAAEAAALLGVASPRKPTE